MAPTVVTAALCVIVVPEAVSDVSGVVPPTMPDSVTTPLPVNVNVFAPLIVVEKLMLEPVATTFPAKETAPVIVIGELLVVTLPFKLIAPV